jgi:predicted ABC-type transport system involved in lysophospholipase L1 biosynthesis ATPase subunit
MPAKVSTGRDVHALRDVSLFIKNANFFPSWGRTVREKHALNLIGLDQPSSGQIFIDGKPPRHIDSELTMCAGDASAHISIRNSSPF